MYTTFREKQYTKMFTVVISGSGSWWLYSLSICINIMLQKEFKTVYRLTKKINSKISAEVGEVGGGGRTGDGHDWV